MSMRRFIHFAKMLNESTGDPSFDREIEAELHRMVPEKLQEPVFDMLMILRNSAVTHPEGISYNELAREFEKLYPDEMNSEEVFKAMRTAFTGMCFLITNNGDDDDLIHWIAENPPGASQPKRHEEEELDMSSPLAQTAKTQIEITHDMLNRARRMGEFNLGGMARVAMSHGVPSQMAMMLARHMVDQFPKLFQYVSGDDAEATYRVVGEERKDAMSTLRDAARRASENGNIDGE